MAEEKREDTGVITWADLTIPNAEEIRDFYSKVVGWKPVPVSMGDYSDYCMNAPQSGRTAAGICHARGSNSALPAQWLIYITVANLDESARLSVELGGTIISGPHKMGDQGVYCVIQDPAGAVAALFQPA